MNSPDTGLRESSAEAAASKLPLGRAFDEIVREHGPRMLAVIRRYVRNDADAQDALQDAFVSAFSNAEQYRGESSLGTWLHTIACRAALMKLRSSRRFTDVTGLDELLPAYEADGHRVPGCCDWPESPVDLASRREVRGMVRQAIDELPEPYRVALMLRDIDGLSTEEAAACLGLNEGAVKTRLHRARQALRTLIARRMRDLGTTGDQP